jgi:hypothetical protein
MATVAPKTTPQDVGTAVNIPDFYQKPEFWQMLNFLFSSFDGKIVHTLLTNATFRKIICQLHQFVEWTDNYDFLVTNSELIYHVYFVSLASIRGYRSNAEMHAHESHDVLVALYQTYRLLFKFKRYNLPCFGHPLKK